MMTEEQKIAARKESQRKYAEKNKAKIQEYRQQYMKDNAKELSDKRHEYYIAHKKESLDYRHKYYAEHKDAVYSVTKEWCKNNRVRRSNAAKEYRIRNPEKESAHLIVANAIKSGKLIKGPCYICGSTKRINCHHPDYNKPLDVIFLCPIHHSRLHKILKLIGG